MYNNYSRIHIPKSLKKSNKNNEIEVFIVNLLFFIILKMKYVNIDLLN